MDCKCPDDTNLTGAADLLGGRKDIQKNHNKLEKCAFVIINELQPAARPCTRVRAIPSVKSGWGINELNGAVPVSEDTAG